LHGLFVEPVSQEFIHPDSDDIPGFVHHKTQGLFSLKFALRASSEKSGGGVRCNTGLMVVENLVLRDIVSGATELRFSCSADLFFLPAWQ
jgi:hypothetical protein